MKGFKESVETDMWIASYLENLFDGEPDSGKILTIKEEFVSHFSCILHITISFIYLSACFQFHFS